MIILFEMTVAGYVILVFQCTRDIQNYSCHSVLAEIDLYSSSKYQQQHQRSFIFLSGL